MGYIMDLRKIVGHRTLLQVGASVIVEDERGRVLLQKRTDNHCWGYPGGSTELDERVEDAAARELLEETGLTANNLVSNIDVVFLCRDYTGTLSCQEEESEALRFFEPGQLPEKLSPPIVIPLRKWEANRLAGQ